MNHIAPDILRQRLLIEAYYQAEIDQKKIIQFLKEIAGHLDLRIYAEPIVHVTEEGGPNQGYDGFVPLYDSGISVYVWTAKKFMSIILYTCKNFDINDAVAFVKNDFKTTDELEWKEF